MWCNLYPLTQRSALKVYFKLNNNKIFLWLHLSLHSVIELERDISVLNMFCTNGRMMQFMEESQSLFISDHNLPSVSQPFSHKSSSCHTSIVLSQFCSVYFLFKAVVGYIFLFTRVVACVDRQVNWPVRRMAYLADKSSSPERPSAEKQGHLLLIQKTYVQEVMQM